MKVRPTRLFGAAVHAAFLFPLLSSGLQAWTVTATPKGPNQINLTWSAQPDPGYGYIVEVQSPDDPRYSVFTEIRPIPLATGYTCDPTINWTGKGTGCTISDPTGAYVYNPAVHGIPTWVTEPQYVDPQDGTPAQFIAAGLMKNSRYTFRVRTYKGNVAPTYGAYSGTAAATTLDYPVRYVSPTGNDANDGTAIDDAHAWRTMGMAASVPCGTLVLAKGGDYAAEYFSLNQACSPDRKVVLQSNYGQVARITSNAHPDWGGALSINGTNVVVDGIATAENAQPYYVVTLDGTHNAVFNMNIGPTMIPSGYGGLTIQGSLNLVYGNYIHDFGTPYYVQNANGGGGFVLELDYGASQNVIWSNHLTRGAHDCTLVHNGAANKFLNNIADGGWGMAFETVYQGSQDNLFEGTIGLYAGALEANIYKPAFELSYKSNTVRRSIFANAGTAMEISAYDDATNNLVYNNVFYNVARCYFQSHNFGVSAYDGVMVQNNICQYTYDATDIYLPNATPNAISYNNIVKMGGTGREASVIWNQDAGAPYAYYVTLDYADANYGNGAWYRNAALSTAPAAFIDPANLDFHLTSTSPLRGAGVRVADPNWGNVFGSTVDLGPYGIDLPSAVSTSGTNGNLTPIVGVVSSLNPATVGQAVTFTATLSSQLATGTMQFLDGTTVIGTVPVNVGIASLTTTILAAGSHSITAAYGGDGSFNPASSPAITQSVKANTTISIASSLNPAMAGQSVQLTATVSANAATGTVQFMDGATTLGTLNLANGSAVLTTSALTGGAHSITATYSGDASFNGSTSAALVQAIRQTSTVALAVDIATPAPGQTVGLTASLSPSAATGTVQFLDGATVLATAPVANGIATLAISTLSLGAHSITAAYSGDAAYGSSTSAAISLSVGKANSSLALASSLNPAAAGQAVTFSATVSPLLATGSIQFLDGATVLGTSAITAGTARFTTSALAGGSHTIKAVYSGDAGYNASSITLSQLINSTASVSISAANTSVTVGQAVQLTASLPPAATGTVQFRDGATVLGTATISGGAATLSVSTLTPGTHNVTANYSGDSTYGAASSTALAILVSKANSSVALTPSQNPSVLGASVTFTATVSPASATGSVQFLDGATALGTVTLSGGVAVLSISTLSGGNHTITVTYAGDASLNASTSPAVTEVVSVPVPARPTQLTAIAYSASQIRLSWTASTTTGVTYNVYASPTPGFTPSASNRIATGVAATAYTDSGLPSGTTRYYLVTAQKATVESAPSNQAGAVTRGR